MMCWLYCKPRVWVFACAALNRNIIEILLRVGGLEFEPAFARAIQVPMGEIQVFIIHPHDQIINKRIAGRSKDLVDVENLVKRYGEPPSE